MKRPHIGLGSDDVTKIAILVDDKEDMDEIIQLCTHSESLEDQREFTSTWCEYNSIPFILISHGVGSASIAICVEELVQCGVEFIVKYSTSGVLSQGSFRNGDIFLSTSTCKEDSISKQLVPSGYPAVCSTFLLGVVSEHFHKHRIQYQKGISLSTDIFYHTDYSRKMLLEPYSSLGVSVVELGTGALFVLGSLREVEVLSVSMIDGCMTSVTNGDLATFDREALRRELFIALLSALEEVGESEKSNIHEEMHAEK